MIMSQIRFSGRSIFQIFYFVLMISLFFIFQQVDLYHTVISSYAYLEGHSIDFYEFNKERLGGNDYLPLIYVIFAIWNLPLDFMGLAPNFEMQLPAWWVSLPLPVLFWNKFLLCIFFVATTSIVYRIANLIQDPESAHRVSWIFLTMPFSIFAVFIMGQYDIIGLFFTMFGFWFLVRRKPLLFAIMFSFAISFKYFAIIIFIPLLLLLEKRIVFIVLYFAVAMIVTVIQFAIYSGSEVFLSSAFKLAAGKVSVNSDLPIKLIVTGVMYCMVCCFSYFKKNVLEDDFCFYAVVTPIISYCLMFSYVVWHPQWLIIIAPFIALGFLYSKNSKFYQTFDLLVGLSFFVVFLTTWPTHVDVSMAGLGVFRDVWHTLPIVNFDLLPPISKVVATYVFYISLLLMPGILIFYKFKSSKMIPLIAGESFYSARLIVIIIFVMSSFFCIFITPDNVSRFFKTSDLRYLKTMIASGAMIPIGELVTGLNVVQSFTSEKEGLLFVSPLMATYERENSCDIQMSLVGESDELIASQRFDARSLGDSRRLNFLVGPIENSKNKIYKLRMSSNNCKSGNAITVWRSENESYELGSLSINGSALNGDLNLAIYYR